VKENKRRTNRIMVWVSDEEKNLLETKANYYGYKTLAGYVRDSATFEKMTCVDIEGKQELYNAYSEYTKEIKKIVKEIRNINKYNTQMDFIESNKILSLMYNIIKNQKDLLKLTEKKLDLKVWQKINRNKKKEE